MNSCGPLWILPAVVLAASVIGGDAYSCHEVRTAFQLRQVGPLHRVPETPGTGESWRGGGEGGYLQPSSSGGKCDNLQDVAAPGRNFFSFSPLFCARVKARVCQSAVRDWRRALG